MRKLIIIGLIVVLITVVSACDRVTKEELIEEMSVIETVDIPTVIPEPIQLSSDTIALSAETVETAKIAEEEVLELTRLEEIEEFDLIRIVEEDEEVLKIIVAEYEAVKIAEFDVKVEHQIYKLIETYEINSFKDFINKTIIDEFQEVIKNIKKFPLIILNETYDYGIGIYSENFHLFDTDYLNAIFIYIGDYKDNLRHGYGTWIAIDDYFISIYQGYRF